MKFRHGSILGDGLLEVKVNGPMDWEFCLVDDQNRSLSLKGDKLHELQIAIIHLAKGLEVYNGQG